jgi:hypothetical protein
MSDPYDPQKPEEVRRGSQYISRKDVKIISIVLLVLFIAAWPVYLYMLANVNKASCSKNMRKIATALSTYRSEYDDHMPYAYETASYSSSDIALKGGYAYSWQWLLEPYTDGWKVFSCPAAQPSENTITSDGGHFHASSYGMLNGYSSVSYSSIIAPGSRIIIGETARNGAMNTFDPLQLQAGGKPLNDDGFMIGFDNDQSYPNSRTQFATRLAFPDSRTKGLNAESSSRHPDGIHFLTVDGSLWTRGGEIARVIEMQGNFGAWDVPNSAGTSRKPLAP